MPFTTAHADYKTARNEVQLMEFLATINKPFISTQEIADRLGWKEKKAHRTLLNLEGITVSQPIRHHWKLVGINEPPPDPLPRVRTEARAYRPRIAAAGLTPKAFKCSLNAIGLEIAEYEAKRVPNFVGLTGGDPYHLKTLSVAGLLKEGNLFRPYWNGKWRLEVAQDVQHDGLKVSVFHQGKGRRIVMEPDMEVLIEHPIPFSENYAHLFRPALKRLKRAIADHAKFWHRTEAERRVYLKNHGFSSTELQLFHCVWGASTSERQALELCREIPADMGVKARQKYLSEQLDLSLRHLQRVEMMVIYSPYLKGLFD